MKILHLANHCDDIGNGIMNVAVDIACSQARLGHQVAFASAGGRFVELLDRHQVVHHQIAQPWRQPVRLGAAAIALRRLLGRFAPNIVHAHMMTGAVLAYALRGRLHYRLVTTVHNEWQRSALLMGLGDRVIAVSDAVRIRMQQRGVSARKLRVVRNATLGSPRRPGSAPQGSLELRHPAIVTVAGMFHRKGIPELIEAFATLAACHSTAHLYLVGDGPDRPAFEARAAGLPCRERIRFVGFVRDPRPYLLEADVFVLASRNDPSPLVIPEAREAGCAIVATAVGGIPESLDDGRAGILVPSENPAALAGAIGVLLDDAGARARYRDRARENLSRLHLDRAVGETMAIYAQALHETGKPGDGEPAAGRA